MLDGLRELSIIMPSILARINQFPTAIVFLNQSKQLFSFEENTWLKGALDLLHASCTLHLARMDN